MLTASEMKFIITPTLKMSNDSGKRSHLYELLAQRITGYVELHYIGDDIPAVLEERSRRRRPTTNTTRSSSTSACDHDGFGFTIGHSKRRHGR